MKLSGILLLFCPFSICMAQEATTSLKVPEDFRVSPFSGPDLANDIHCMHIDEQGRIVVAGRGYVRQLLDTNGDGLADKSVEIIPPVKGWPMGLLWEKEVLYVCAEGGLWRYTGVDGNSPSRNKPELILALKSQSEHDAHAVRRGPDGWLYWLGGNNAGVTEKTVRGTGSPITKPIAGCMLRISPDHQTIQIMAHGFRNPYDFDFNTNGDIFTFDSDNERCVGLPWYEHTRLYHVYDAGHYGWLNPQFTDTWRRPPYFPDCVAPVCTAGRGSPTGVCAYRHTAFPQKFQGGIFFADWTFGKIWFTQPEWKAKGGYTAKPEAFLTATGDNGFAPTSVCVEPKSGDLFISVGGRGTRGAVYRVSYRKKANESQPIPMVRASRLAPLPFVPNPMIEPKQLSESNDHEDRLKVIRSWQLAWGDLCAKGLSGTSWEGYTLRSPPSTADSKAYVQAILKEFPREDRWVNRELARTLAALEPNTTEAVRKLSQHLATLEDPIEQIHYLMCLARIGGERSDADRQSVVTSMLTLDERFEKNNYTRDRHWPTRMNDTMQLLVKHDPMLAQALSQDARYGQASHLWIARVPGISKIDSAKAFVRTAGKTKEFAWTGGHMPYLAELPEAERNRWFEQLWKIGGLEDAILLQWSKHASEENRSKLIQGLSSTQADVVAASAKALEKLSNVDSIDEAVAGVKTLRRFADSKVDRNVREQIVALLKKRSGQDFGTDTKDWERWLLSKYPEASKKLTSPGYDPELWKNRLKEIAWDQGNAERGKAVFMKTKCAACHNAGSAVGPNLQGVSKRFSRDDLLTAILDPNKEISPRYRTTRITTHDERIYEGMVIYDAVDGTILQTGADTTTRVAGQNIALKKPGLLSLMPVGLLDASSPAEIADLIQYLQSLNE